MDWVDKIKKWFGRGDDQKSLPEQTILVTILLAKESMPDAEAVDRALAASLPREVVESAVEDRGGLQRVRVLGGEIHWTVLPVCIADTDAARAVQGSGHWRRAKPAVAGHQAHLLVYARGSKLRRVALADLVSRVVAVLVPTLPAVAVLWNDASLLHDPESFRQLASSSSPERLPVPLWIAVAILAREGEPHLVITRGLEAFGLMEIEASVKAKKPEAAWDLVAGTAHHLLLSGPVLEDGHTVGGDDGDRNVVQHRSSELDAQRQVYRLEL